MHVKRDSDTFCKDTRMQLLTEKLIILSARAFQNKIISIKMFFAKLMCHTDFLLEHVLNSLSFKEYF